MVEIESLSFTYRTQGDGLPDFLTFDVAYPSTTPNNVFGPTLLGAQGATGGTGGTILGTINPDGRGGGCPLLSF
jgi:hypothetical protein